MKGRYRLFVTKIATKPLQVLEDQQLRIDLISISGLESAKQFSECTITSPE
jgi:hypothetical protein